MFNFFPIKKTYWILTCFKDIYFKRLRKSEFLFKDCLEIGCLFE